MCQDRQDTNAQALLHIRKLRGGSQPILVRANDGFFYVVKFLDNLQGVNLLFNEALGTELYRRAGLPVPEWRPIFVSDDFLDQNPACWMETEHGRYRPQSGYCFGSRFLGLRDASLFEILPGRSFSRIKNRRDFWTARVLDVLCEHTDNRQALFLQRDSGPLEAYFVDHGHLFGGARGDEPPRMMASRYLDSRIYAAPTAEDAQRIQEAIQRVELSELLNIAYGLPRGWCTEIALERFARFARQVSDTSQLKRSIRVILGEDRLAGKIDDRCGKKCVIRTRRSGLHASIPVSEFGERICVGCSDFAGDQGQHGPQSICPPYTYAANS
jgi:hypothetical protein